MQTRRKTPWLPLGIGLTVALASALAYFKLRHKSPPPLPTVTNSLDMTFVQVPAGKFLMGSPTTETQRQDETQHEVEITRPFYLGTTEVTQGQYLQVMGTNPSVLPGASKPGRLKYAVDNVSWDEAVEFCKRLSALPEEKAAGRSYRLPTEAEWEYACRAGSTTAFAFGNKLTDQQANIRPLKILEKNLSWFQPVRSHQPNAFELYDMHGGVWEWCSDWYGKDYYQKSPEQDPQGPKTGVFRVVRGGSWSDDAADCRSARRLALAPGIRLGNGLRVVLVEGPPR